MHAPKMMKNAIGIPVLELSNTMGMYSGYCLKLIVHK